MSDWPAEPETSSFAGPVPAARRRIQRIREWCIEKLLLGAALFSILITGGIVLVLVVESFPFFRQVSLVEFFTDTMWTPMYARPRYGILPLLCGTLVTTGVALAVSIPLGSIIAIWLSEFASNTAREIVKPILELLSAVPTVVYGYFAISFVTPLLQKVFPSLPTFNMLGAGLVMGIMIIPYVSSLSEDALRAVPRSLREASYAVAANRSLTAFCVIYPAALSGITSAYILAISRAVGETMIVAIAAGQQPTLTLSPFDPAATITAFIVQVSLGDLPHGSIGYQSIFAAGTTLFMVTLLFNVLGVGICRRYREVY